MLGPVVFDCYIDFDSSAICTLDPNNRPVAGACDVIGVIEHEIFPVMGRQMFEKEFRPKGAAPGYSLLYFFRYFGR